MAPHRRGAVAMVGSTASWGFGTVISKLTLDRTHLHPVTLQAMELAASIVVLLAIATSRGRRPERTTWRAARAGILEPGASYVLGLIGLSMTAASHASIIGALEPILVVLASWWLLRRRPSHRTAVLMVVSLGGAVAVLVGSAGGADGTASIAGDIVMLASVACAAAYVLLSSRATMDDDPWTTTLAQQLWALVIVVPALVLVAATSGSGPMPSGADWWLVVVSGLLSYLVPFGLYLTALGTLPAATAAQFLALIPLCGLLGAATLLGESLTPVALAGGAVVVAALVGLARPDAVDEVPPSDTSSTALRVPARQ